MTIDEFNSIEAACSQLDHELAYIYENYAFVSSIKETMEHIESSINETIDNIITPLSKGRVYSSSVTWDSEKNIKIRPMVDGKPILTKTNQRSIGNIIKVALINTCVGGVCNAAS